MPAVKERARKPKSSQRPVSRGLRTIPYSKAESIREHAGLSPLSMAEFLGVSDRTYERRSQEGQLRAAESVKVEFLDGALTLATQVLKSEAKGRGWLSTPLVPFGSKTPLQMLDSVQGYERVRNALNRIRYGMY